MKVFKFITTNELGNQKLVYRKSEYSLDTIPTINSDIYIFLDNLQIGFDSSNNCCTQLFGYFPQLIFSEKKEFSIPDAQKGILMLCEEEHDFISGDSVRLSQAEKWVLFYSESTGYIYFGNNQLSDGIEYLEFFSNCIAAINDSGELEGLWLLIDFGE